jgi:hypothetical protein
MLTNKITPSKIYLLWSFVILVFLCLLFVVAPGRGAAWIQDDGLFLLMSWDAANGLGLDRMLPQAPQYLFHALLMKVGLQEYLHFRYVNYILILLSSLVFFLGIDRRRFKSPVVPVAVCACLLVSANSIENPNSLALAFFLFGAGCYFFSTDTTHPFRHIFLLLCGVLFAVAGFMHAAVVIAMILLIGIIWFIDHSIRRSFLLPGFLLISLLLWNAYISSLGIESLLAPPAGHDSSIRHLAYSAWLIFAFYLKIFFLFLLALWVFRKRKHDKFVMAQTILSVVVTFLCIASLITYLGGSTHRFPGWMTVSQIPAPAFFLLLFVVFRWLGERTFYPNGVQLPERSDKEAQPSRKSQFLLFRASIHRILSELSIDTLCRKRIVAVCGLILIQAALAAGSASSIMHGMVTFAGPAIGLTIIMWDSLDRSGHVSSRVLVMLAIAWLSILGTISFTYNHPTNQHVISSGRVVLEDSPLRGILEQPRYAAAVNKLGEAYKANKCESKTMLALDYIPMVYYILQHPAPNSIGVVRPIMYFPEERIKSALDPQIGWCVIDATGIETQEEIERNHGFDKRASIRTWVQNQSDRVITIPSPSAEIIGDIHFIVRDTRLKPN